MTDRADAVAALRALQEWSGPSIPTDLAVLIIAAERACLAALAPADPTADLRAAAQAVVDKADPDEGFEGEYIDYLVPYEALDTLRAALAASTTEDET